MLEYAGQCDPPRVALKLKHAVHLIPRFMGHHSILGSQINKGSQIISRTAGRLDTMQSTQGQATQERYDMSQAANFRTESYSAMGASPPPGHPHDEGEWDEHDHEPHGEEEGDEGEGEDDEEEEEEGEGDEEEYAASETSSAMYDAAADPEGFATRLDELAGVLEMGEEEMQALKWGPNIGRGVDSESASCSRANMEDLKVHECPVVI